MIDKSSLRRSGTLILTLGIIFGSSFNGSFSSAQTEKTLKSAESKHWAFVPPRYKPPQSKTNQAHNLIDLFIDDQLRQKNLIFSPRADKLTLIRRVTYDLVGLPPSPEEIDNFLKDSSPGAYEKVVERLLSSPHFGERQAQWWLDVVRFSESNGYEMDADRPHAWRYRDYVLNSFNRDKPFNRFLTEQIAGDELADSQTGAARAELYAATGLHRCGPVHLVSGNVDPEVTRQEMLIEMVTGVGAAFMGITMNCARCHDHKIDPVSQADYYKLEAFFAAAQYKNIGTAPDAERQAHQREMAELRKIMQPLQAQVSAIDEPHRKKIREQKLLALEAPIKEAYQTPANKRTEAQKQLAKDADTLLKITWDEIVAALSPEEKIKRQAIRDQIHALSAQMTPAPGEIWAIANDSKVPDTHVLKRGEVKRKLQIVKPGYPTAIVANQESPTRLNRIDLANWLTDPKHPLTARVIVNRLWQHHFGKGLVRTPNDYGKMGERPTHPELLDYLALELIAKNWSLKALHRQMVLSTTYCQESAPRGDGNKIDPENKLLWRMNRRRLGGEEIRDAMLAASGRLHSEVGGLSVRIPLEPEVYDLIFTEGEPDGLWLVTPDQRQHDRRSLYLFSKRNVRLPIFEAFDAPDTLSPCGQRPLSTHSPQALIMMNGPMTKELANRFGERLLKLDTLEEQIRLAYRLALGRTPSPAEQTLSQEFIAQQADIIESRLLARQPVLLPGRWEGKSSPAQVGALVDFCLALFNTNEFIYIR